MGEWKRDRRMGGWEDGEKDGRMGGRMVRRKEGRRERPTDNAPVHGLMGAKGLRNDPSRIYVALPCACLSVSQSVNPSVGHLCLSLLSCPDVLACSVTEGTCMPRAI